MENENTIAQSQTPERPQFQSSYAYSLRRSGLVTPIHHARETDGPKSICGFLPRNGWKQSVRAVDCPKCLARLQREAAK